MTPEEQIAQYERDIADAGLPLPDDYKDDPVDMQIAKLDDRLRRAALRTDKEGQSDG